MVARRALSSLHPAGMLKHLECLCYKYRIKSNTRALRQTTIQKGTISSRKRCLSMAETLSPRILAIRYPPKDFP